MVKRKKPLRGGVTFFVLKQEYLQHEIRIKLFQFDCYCDACFAEFGKVHLCVILRRDAYIDFITRSHVKKQNLDQLKTRVECRFDDAFCAVAESDVLGGSSDQRKEGMGDDADRWRQ